jgi:hypothetical protein
LLRRFRYELGSVTGSRIPVGAPPGIMPGKLNIAATLGG